MTSLTILTDSDVQNILHGITTAEAHTLATALEDAFVTYSCRGDARYQPHRSVITRESTGATSIFMPATTPRSIGVKIVGVSGGSASPREKAETMAAGSGNGGGGGEGEASAPVKAGLKSILTLCDATSGRPVGVLNAAELTGFRTALGSMLLYRLRKVTAKIAVFGAGKQAEWHIRLAVLLRGADIREVTIVNRSKDRTRQLVEKLKADGGRGSWPAHITLEAFSEDSSSGGGGGLEELVANADVLFFTTPSKKPLFPASFLLSEQARRKTRYLAAIGSYTLDMAEIDPDLVTAVGQSPLASQGWQGGRIVVDSREACLQEAGEFVKSGLSSDKWLDIGHVTEMLGRGEGQHEEGLREWLESGFVIYKSVGVGIMDIAIGDQLLELAKGKSMGTFIENF
ncbi:alanine dehydrogenase [Microdochium nivale]|nr:alanine dehydrogenase [Microdochium nivale]